MVGKRIKHFREAKNLKRHWLGEKLGINATQVNRIENDKCEVSIERLYDIAVALDVSIIDLFEEKYLHGGKVKSYDKYGPVESSFIRYVIYQNEMLQLKHDQLLTINQELLAHLNVQVEQFNKLIKIITPPPPRKTKK